METIRYNSNLFSSHVGTNNSVFSSHAGTNGYNSSVFSLQAGTNRPEYIFYTNIIVTTCLTGAISLCGSVFNIINIVVFIKQGSRDSVNTSLIGLAVSDVGASISMFFWSQQYNPLIKIIFQNVDTVSIMMLTSGWPHVLFTRTTCLITAFIIFERYLCVAYPLKVKMILTKNDTLVAIVCIFVIMISNTAPLYVSCRLGAYYLIYSNITTLRLHCSSNWNDIRNMVVSIGAIVELAAFTVTAIFTFALVQKFLAKIKWRRTKVTSPDTSGMSRKDKQVVQMVILISVIFIVSYIPSVTTTIIIIILEESGTFDSALLSDPSSAFASLFESVNSTLPIFIYLKMSSRFRATFMNLFGR